MHLLTQYYDPLYLNENEKDLLPYCTIADNLKFLEKFKEFDISDLTLMFMAIHPQYQDRVVLNMVEEEKLPIYPIYKEYLARAEILMPQQGSMVTGHDFISFEGLKTPLKVIHVFCSSIRQESV